MTSLQQASWLLGFLCCLSDKHVELSKRFITWEYTKTTVISCVVCSTVFLLVFGCFLSEHGRTDVRESRVSQRAAKTDTHGGAGR